MDTVTLLGRLLVSLAAVLGLMWVLARRTRRGMGRPGQLIDVVGRRQLSRTASVAVVRVLDQALVVGVTDGHVSVLGTLDAEAVDEKLAEAAPPKRERVPATRITADASVPTEARGALAGSALSPSTWKQTVNALRDITVRTR